MQTLYIIGNGFDLHHGMPTSYASFHRFIEEYNIDLANEMEECFDFTFNSESRWCDFENDLGTYNNKVFFDTCNELDPTAEGFEWNDALGLEDDIVERMDNFIEGIRNSFAAWVDAIEYPPLEIYRKKLLNLKKGSKLISFNYTATLEDLYGIPPHQILYIHNKSEELGDGVIFGHGRSIEQYPKQPEQDENGDSTRTAFTDAEDAARTAFYALKKDTAEILKRHQDYFNEISGIEEVIVLGHSLGAVDMPYFQQIIKESPGAIWKFSCYGDREREDMRKRIVSDLSISEGKFALFSMSELTACD